TAAAAGLAGILPLKLDRLFRPLGHLAQRQLDLRLQVEPAAGPAAAAPGPTAEAAAEDVVEHREDVADVHVREVVLTGDPAVTVLVVAGPLLVVTQDLICLGRFLEAHLRLGLVTVTGTVGVIF